MRKIRLRVFVVLIVLASLVTPLQFSTAQIADDPPYPIEKISVAYDGGQANDASFSGDVSADGRYVIFYSHATNLIEDDANPGVSLYLRDRVLGTTTKIASLSEIFDIGPQAKISADGNWVVFVSNFDDVTSTNVNEVNVNDPDLFLYSRETGETTLITQGKLGQVPEISANGRWIVFTSSNVDIGSPYSHVFLYDRVTDTVQLISKTINGSPANGRSSASHISDDGQVIAYSSFATNLVADDTNNLPDIFVYSVANDTTERIEANAWTIPALSGDGSLVAFVSISQLLTGDTNNGGDLYVYDRTSDELTLVTPDSSGGFYDGAMFEMGGHFTTDGRYIVFYSMSNPSTISNIGTGIYRYDTVTDVLTQISDAQAPTFPFELWPITAGDGSAVAFHMYDTNLTGSYSALSDVYVFGESMLQSDTNPVIAAIPDQTINENQALAAVDFTIEDAETAPDVLLVSAISSDQTLIPDANILLGGEGINRTIALSPAVDQIGVASITVTVTDEDNNIATTSFDVTVNEVNLLPVANDDQYIVDEDSPLNVSAPGVLANDTDPDGTPLTVILETLPSHGALVLNANGAFTYTPTPNYNGTDAFSYRVVDTNGAVDLATVTLTVNASNDAPTVAINNPSVTVERGQLATNSGTYADLDSDNIFLSANLGMVSNNANGTFSWNLTTGELTPATSTVTITASDSNGGSATTSFNLTVNNPPPPPNTPPTIAMNNPSVTVERGQVATNSGIYNDVDSHSVTLTASVGQVSNNANGTFSWSLTTSDAIPAISTVTITVNDGQGGITSTNFSLTVNTPPPTTLNNLQLTSMCSPDPSSVRVWRVRNSNAADIVFTWDVYGTSQTGTATAFANTDVFFQTQAVPNSPNTVRVFVNGVLQQTKASGTTTCSG